MSDDDMRARVAEVLRQNDERIMNFGHCEWDDMTDEAQQMYLVDADAVLAVLPRYEQVGWRSPTSGDLATLAAYARHSDWLPEGTTWEPVYRRLPTEGVQR